MIKKRKKTAQKVKTSFWSSGFTAELWGENIRLHIHSKTQSLTVLYSNISLLKAQNWSRNVDMLVWKCIDTQGQKGLIRVRLYNPPLHSLSHQWSRVLTLRAGKSNVGLNYWKCTSFPPYSSKKSHAEWKPSWLPQSAAKSAAERAKLEEEDCEKSKHLKCAPASGVFWANKCSNQLQFLPTATASNKNSRVYRPKNMQKDDMLLLHLLNLLSVGILVK